MTENHTHSLSLSLSLSRLLTLSHVCVCVCVQSGQPEQYIGPSGTKTELHMDNFLVPFWMSVYVHHKGHPRSPSLTHSICDVNFPEK